MRSHRLKLVVPAGLVALAAVSIALHGAELPAELVECRTLSSTVARLGCYDQVVDAHTAIPDRAAEGQKAAPVARESVLSPSQEDLFGKDEAEKRKAVEEATGTKEIEQIEATVIEVRRATSGMAIITLDNGQIWKQTDGSRTRLSANDQITIRRASFGSYMLHKNKSAMRVKRIS